MAAGVGRKLLFPAAIVVGQPGCHAHALICSGCQKAVCDGCIEELACAMI